MKLEGRRQGRGAHSTYRSAAALGSQFLEGDIDRGRAVLAVEEDLFALIWTGVVVGMFVARAHGSGPPLFFALLFGFFDILIVWGFVDSWIGTGRIEIDGGTLRWQRGILGMGPRGEIGKSGIRELLVVAGSRVNNNQRYAVVVVDSFGRRRKISRELTSRRAADTLIAELRRALA